MPAMNLSQYIKKKLKLFACIANTTSKRSLWNVSIKNIPQLGFGCIIIIESEKRPYISHKPIFY